MNSSSSTATTGAAKQKSNNSINNINNNINNDTNKASTMNRPYSAKLNSRFSASQPYLPVFEPSSNHQHQETSPSSYNKLKKAGQNNKLNLINELASNEDGNANNNNNNSNSNYLSKTYNSLISSTKLLGQVVWSEKAYDLRELIDSNNINNNLPSNTATSKSSLSSSHEMRQQQSSNKLHQILTQINMENEMNNERFPVLAKVVKGTYGVVKETNSPIIKNSVYNLLIYKKCKFINVLCQSIKLNQDKKPMPYGNKLSIPITYGGWFEVLSEDGKSIKLLNSVKELVSHSISIYNMKKKSNKLTSLNTLPNYLIRENLNAYLIPKTSVYSKEMKANATLFEAEYSTASLNDCKKIVIKTGDKLQIIGEIYLDNNANNQASFDNQTQNSNAKSSLQRNKLIKCLLERTSASKKEPTAYNNNNKNTTLINTEMFINNNNGINNLNRINSHENILMDSNNPTDNQIVVYLSEDSKGKFSPIARMENISGVHKLQDILKKFRFPITVQLVYGRAPSSMSSSSLVSTASGGSASSQSNKNQLSSKSNSQFSPILRLMKIYEVENLLAYPLGKESCLIQIPTYSNIKVLVADNMKEIMRLHADHGYLRHVLNDCGKLAPEYANMINYLPQPPPQSTLDAFNQTVFSESFFNNLIGRAILVNKNYNISSNSNSRSHNNSRDEKYHYNNNKTNFIMSGGTSKYNNNNYESCLNDDENRAYKEIDDLYEYVRSGVLPEYIKNENTNFEIMNNSRPQSASIQHPKQQTRNNSHHRLSVHHNHHYNHHQNSINSNNNNNPPILINNDSDNLSASLNVPNNNKSKEDLQKSLYQQKYKIIKQQSILKIEKPHFEMIMQQANSNNNNNNNDGGGGGGKDENSNKQQQQIIKNGEQPFSLYQVSSPTQNVNILNTSNLINVVENSFYNKILKSSTSNNKSIERLNVIENNRKSSILSYNDLINTSSSNNNNNNNIKTDRSSSSKRVATTASEPKQINRVLQPTVLPPPPSVPPPPPPPPPVPPKNRIPILKHQEKKDSIFFELENNLTSHNNINNNNNNNNKNDDTPSFNNNSSKSIYIQHNQHNHSQSSDKILDSAGSYFIKLNNDFKLADFTDGLINNNDSSASYNIITKDFSSATVENTSNNKQQTFIKTHNIQLNTNGSHLLLKPTTVVDDRVKERKYWYTSIQDLNNYYPINNDYTFEYMNKDMLITSDDYLTTESQLLSQLNLYPNLRNNNNNNNNNRGSSRDISMDFYKEINSDDMNKF